MNKPLVALLGLFFISFTLFMTYFVLGNTNLAKFTRAASEKTLSPSNSLVLLYPYTIKTGETATITVSLRDKDGGVVTKKRIRVQTDIGQTKESTQEADDKGMATFHYSSETEGIAHIKVYEESTNMQIGKELTVKIEPK